jgi:hypothetical protein
VLVKTIDTSGKSLAYGHRRKNKSSRRETGSGLFVCFDLFESDGAAIADAHPPAPRSTSRARPDLNLRSVSAKWQKPPLKSAR